MPGWPQIAIELPTPSGNLIAKVNVAKQSFWSDCRDLISDVAGRWLLDQGGPWPKGQPPKFHVELMRGGLFGIKGLVRPV